MTGPPIKKVKGRREPPGRPSTTNVTSTHQSADTGILADTCQQLRTRHAASWRLPGGDPWNYKPPTAGYEAAALHLLSSGLLPAPNVPAMREMWKANTESRRAVQVIAERWGLVA